MRTFKNDTEHNQKIQFKMVGKEYVANSPESNIEAIPFEEVTLQPGDTIDLESQDNWFNVIDLTPTTQEESQQSLGGE